MTCVVGWITKNDVIIGADTAGCRDDDFLVSRLDEKVFISGPMIIGYSNSFRLGQLLKYNLITPEHPTSMEAFEYMVSKFIPAVKEALDKNQYPSSSLDGELLVGYDGQLFHIGSGLEVGQPQTAYYAIGSGSIPAIGAMTVLYEQPRQLTDELSVKLALETAERWNVSVRGPFVIMRGGRVCQKE